MQIIMLILCASMLSACGSTGNMAANNEWSNMDYTPSSMTLAGGNYLSISPGMGMK